jgi:predicted ATPase
MVERVTSGKALPPEIVQQIVAKTDGVPLFVEELTKMVVEAMRGQETGDGGQEGKIGGARHAASLPAVGIPASLHDALMARLDRLGVVKEVAQLGAVLGREFSYELIHAVSPLDEVTLQKGLSQLVEAELVYQRGLPPQARYTFKHALVQDTAYQSLLKSTRQQYHQQIATVLEEQFPETKETQPELLAHHYTEAGLVAPALSYWQTAGQRAIERSANLEAISHLTKGLELLKALPDTPERAQQELTLQLTLGNPLMATKGQGVPEVEKVYTRARELCRQVGETPQLLPMLAGLRVFYLIRAELQTARELAEQSLRLAQSIQEPVLGGCHIGLGETLFYLGEFVLAQEHFEQGIALYDPRRSRPPWAWADPGVPSLTYAALVLWILGYPDQALKRIHEALILAQELSHPFSLAFALNSACVLHQFRREVQAAQARAEELVALCTEQQGFPQWLAAGTFRRGWALVEQGQVEEGITQMRQGMDAWRATGAELGRPWFLAPLAEAYGKVGQAEEGLGVLAEALTHVHKTEERGVYEAELYRVKGELSLQSRSPQSAVSDPRPLAPDPQAEAEACFLKAIEIARRQQAKSLELRATMSLARLWQQQGKKEEAQQMLAEIYNWFTEGFDTKDLQEAKALLTELAGEVLISGSEKST